MALKLAFKVGSDATLSHSRDLIPLDYIIGSHTNILPIVRQRKFIDLCEWLVKVDLQLGQT